MNHLKNKHLENELKKRHYVYLGFNLKILMLKSLQSRENVKLKKEGNGDSNVIITAVS